MYRNGNGVKQNYEKAAELYGKGYELGNVKSCYTLANIYFNGEGVYQNYWSAKDWCEKGYNADNEWEYYNLGNIYKNGNGVVQYFEMAIEFYGKAMLAAQKNKDFQNAIEIMDLVIQNFIDMGIDSDLIAPRREKR